MKLIAVAIVFCMVINIVRQLYREYDMILYKIDKFKEKDNNDS